MPIAFPGADGFGKFATGARASNAQVIFVTNLNNSGSGSLREALQTTGNRYIVSTVAGIINLSSELGSVKDNFYLMGQLAPYPGITVAGAGIRIQDVNNFIVRYIRVRVGDDRAGASNVRALTIRDCRLGIVDHCSFSWGMDETASGWGNGGDDWQNQGLSFQWNTVAEPLNSVVGGAEALPHGFNMLLDGNNVSYHHNLICHGLSRNPQWFDRDQLGGVPADRKGLIDFRNNLIFNYSTPMRGRVIDVNIINNMYIPGPHGNGGIRGNRFYHRPELASVWDGEKIHSSGTKILWVYKTLENITSSDGHSISWEDNRLAIRNDGGSDGIPVSTEYFTYTPHPVPQGVYDFNESTHISAEKIMSLSGSRLHRDTHDTRYMDNIINNTFLANGSNGSTNGVIDSQNDVGGWWEPAIQTGDHDIDGISITYKNDNGLPVGTNVANLYDLSVDYPNIEVYANSLVADFVDDAPIVVQTEYYVNPSTGSDLNNGTEGSPLATIAHALTLVEPGNTIYLRRDYVYPSVLVSGKDGTLTDRYKWDAYGTGADPVISASIDPTWFNEGNNIWSYNNSSFSQVNSVIIGGQNKPMGRWPKAQYNTITSALNNESITDTVNLPSAPNVVGGEIVSKKLKWTIDRSTIASQTADTITVVSPSGSNYKAGNGYFLQNHVNLLTEQDEWAFDFDAKKVYIYSTVDPSSLDIKISFNQYAIQFLNSDYHEVRNIVFESAYDYNIFLSGSNNMLFNNCVSRYAGKNGLQTFTSTNVTWERSSMYDINNHGINNRDASQGLTVHRSSFVRIAMIPGLGQNGSGQQDGVYINNTEHNARITNNYFFQIGNCGVYYRGDNCYVARNYAEKCVETVGDGAAFYTFGSYANPYINITCERNIAYDCIGNSDGIDNPKNDGCGFYIDDNCKDVTLRQNYAVKCGYNYYLHNCQDINMVDNIGYDGDILLFISDDNAQGSGNTLRVRNINVQNNNLKALAGQKLVSIRTIGDFQNDDPFLYGVINNNEYDAVDVDPFRSDLTFVALNTYTLAQWRTEFGFDLNSVEIDIDNTKTIYRVNPNKNSEIFQLATTYSDWDSNLYNQVTLQGYGSILLFEEVFTPIEGLFRFRGRFENF